MCLIEYIVSGEDVDGHMVMEPHTYLSYAQRHTYNFHNDLGFSRQKLNKMKLHLDQYKSTVEIFKPLMFGNRFQIDLRIRRLDYGTGSFEIEYSYFNQNDERCALMRSENRMERL